MPGVGKKEGTLLTSSLEVERMDCAVKTAII